VASRPAAIVRPRAIGALGALYPAWRRPGDAYDLVRGAGGAMLACRQVSRSYKTERRAS